MTNIEQLTETWEKHHEEAVEVEEERIAVFERIKHALHKNEPPAENPFEADAQDTRTWCHPEHVQVRIKAEMAKDRAERSKLELLEAIAKEQEGVVEKVERNLQEIVFK